MADMRRPDPASPIVPIAIGCGAFLAFLPALRNGFVWDDLPNLIANPHFRGLGWSHLRWMATAYHMGHYIPTTWLSLALDHAAWGMNPFGYHLTNLVLHAVNAGLFYLVARRLLHRSAALTGRPLAIAAAGAALFFAIHPLRAESVAWVTERRDLVSGGLLFVTLLLYLGAVDAAGARRRCLLGLSVATFGLALAAKSIVMTFPAVLLLLNVYPLRRVSLGHPWSGLRRVLWEVAPFLVLSALLATAAVGAQMPQALGTYPWVTRIVVAVYALGFYVRKTLIPVNLSPLYEVPIPLDPLEARFVISAVAVLAVSVTVLLLRRRWPAALALWAYYVIALSPTLGIAVRAGFQLAADRYSYLGCLGWALGVGALAGWVALARERRAISPALAGLAAVGAVAGLLGLGALTWRQTEVWRSNESLWVQAVRVNPACALCQANLGLVRLTQGAPAMALTHLERAVELRPDRVLVRADLGLALAGLGRLPEAVAHYEAVLAARPDAVHVRRQLALALHRMGRHEASMAEIRTAAEVAPNDAGAQVSLGLALLQMGRPAEAVARFARAVELGAETVGARRGLVEAYLALGQPAMARQELEALRREDPRLADRIQSALPARTP
jgi:tetratricopeptide (TPR) repeat protein